MIDLAGQLATAVVLIAVALAFVYAGWEFIKTLFRSGWVAAGTGLVLAAVCIWALSNIFSAPDAVKTTVDEIKKQTDNVDVTVGG